MMTESTCSTTTISSKKHTMFPSEEGEKYTKEPLVYGFPPPFSSDPYSMNLLHLTIEQLQNLLISAYKEYYKKELPDITSSTMAPPPWWIAAITFDKMLKLQPGYLKEWHQHYLVKLVHKLHISCGFTAVLVAEPDSSTTINMEVDQQRCLNALGLVSRGSKDEPKVSSSPVPEPPVSSPVKNLGRALPNQKRNSLLQQFSFVPISSSLGQSLLADDQKVEHVYPPPYEKYCEMNSLTTAGGPIQKYRLRRRDVPEHFQVVTKRKIIQDGRNARAYVFGKSKTKYEPIRRYMKRELLDAMGTSTRSTNGGPRSPLPSTMSTNKDEVEADLPDPDGSENYAQRMATTTGTPA